MNVTYFIVMLALIYGTAFKEDFPYILVQRTLIVMGIFLLLINTFTILQYFLEIIKSIF